MYMNVIDNKYKDIINLPHHVSKRHPQMSMEDRAAQFGAFAALTGFEDEIEETGRLTDKKINLDEEQKNIINMKLEALKEKMKLKPKISISYFIPDSKKDGGKYVTKVGIAYKIDEFKKILLLEDKTQIYIPEIIEILFI